MKHLIIEVHSQTLKRCDTFKPAAGSVNYLTAHFTFSEDWSGTTKTAKCRKDNAIYEAVIDESGACLIPHEVLAQDETKRAFGVQEFYISAEGVDGAKIITTTEIKIEVDLTGTGEEVNAAEPTPETYAQYIEYVKEVFKDIQGEKGDAFTYEDFTPEQLAALKGADGKTPEKGVDYFTDEEKAEMIAELSHIEAPIIVSSVDEMTDTSKHYVNKTTGTIWAYMKHTKNTEGSTVANFTNVFNADTAMIGYRWSSSKGAPDALSHCILSDFISCDLSSGEHIIRIKNARLHGSGSNAGVVHFTSNENSTAFDYLNNVAMTPTEEEDGVLAYKLGERNGSMVEACKNTKYIRCVAVQMNNSSLVSPQTQANAEKIIITIDEPITYTEVPASTETYYEWTDTGISYAPTFDTDLIGVLGENNVVYLSDNLPSGTYTLKYDNETYDTIGTITIK